MTYGEDIKTLGAISSRLNADMLALNTELGRVKKEVEDWRKIASKRSADLAQAHLEVARLKGEVKSFSGERMAASNAAAGQIVAAKTLENEISKVKTQLAQVQNRCAELELARAEAVKQADAAQGNLALERKVSNRLDDKHAEELKTAREGMLYAQRQLEAVRKDAAVDRQNAVNAVREREDAAKRIIELNTKLANSAAELERARADKGFALADAVHETIQANGRASAAENALKQVREELTKARAQINDAAAKLTLKTGELLREKSNANYSREEAAKTLAALNRKIQGLEADLAAERRKITAITASDTRTEEIRKLSATVQAQQKRLVDVQGDLTVERDARQRDRQVSQEIIESRDRQITILKNELTTARAGAQQLQSSASRDAASEDRLSVTIAELRAKIISLTGELRAERQSRMDDRNLSDQRERKLKEQIASQKEKLARR